MVERWFWFIVKALSYRCQALMYWSFHGNRYILCMYVSHSQLSPKDRFLFSNYWLLHQTCEFKSTNAKYISLLLRLKICTWIFQCCHFCKALPQIPVLSFTSLNISPQLCFRFFFFTYLFRKAKFLIYFSEMMLCFRLYIYMLFDVVKKIKSWYSHKSS